MPNLRWRRQRRRVGQRREDGVGGKREGPAIDGGEGAHLKRRRHAGGNGVGEGAVHLAQILRSQREPALDACFCPYPSKPTSVRSSTCSQPAGAAEGAAAGRAREAAARKERRREKERERGWATRT